MYIHGIRSNKLVGQRLGEICLFLSWRVTFDSWGWAWPWWHVFRWRPWGRECPSLFPCLFSPSSPRPTSSRWSVVCLRCQLTSSRRLSGEWLIYTIWTRPIQFWPRLGSIFYGIQILWDRDSMSHRIWTPHRKLTWFQILWGSILFRVLKGGSKFYNRICTTYVLSDTSTINHVVMATHSNIS